MQLKERLHSEEWIDDHRLEWWDKSFLAVILHPVINKNNINICDFGCGEGHWLLSASRVMDLSQTNITLVDQESVWLQKAEERLRPLCKGLLTYQEDVQKLSFPDASFDFSTCQTLVMHTKDPYSAVSEMIRVTKRGGYLLICEPVNVINRCQLALALRYLTPSESSLLLKVWHAYHLGVQKVKGYHYDIALEMLDIFRCCGYSRNEISIYKNSISVVHGNNDGSLESEYHDDNFYYANIGGDITKNEWNVCRQLSIKLSDLAKDDCTVFTDTLFTFGVIIK
ncbi:MAG: class I SAM-dependent methyltransferase [Gammaproteobacteria bacterium]